MPGASGTQYTSIDPGNEPDGLFWTIPVPNDAVSIDLEEGTASFKANNLVTRDFHDIVNDLLHGPSVPATVSFDAEWSGLTQHVTTTDNSTFTEDLLQSTTGGVSVTWSGTEATQSFTTNPASREIIYFPAIGTERNGVFFTEGEGE
ncbi:MAG: hypothetical protein NVS2B16_26230 [Chloroflexota bacterium]